jgi:hypothetical protein
MVTEARSSSARELTLPQPVRAECRRNRAGEVACAPPRNLRAGAG